jgi:hypothetical protein
MSNPNIKDYGFKKGRSGNPGGMPKGLKKDMNDFKQSLFSLYKKHKKEFEKAALENPMDTLKLLANLCPKEVTGEGGGPVVFEINDRGY